MTPAEDELNRPRDRPRRTDRESGSVRRLPRRLEREQSDPRRSELTRARQILRDLPDVSDDRLEEIKDRIRHGYYSRADVLDRIARRLSGDL